MQVKHVTATSDPQNPFMSASQTKDKHAMTLTTPHVPQII